MPEYDDAWTLREARARYWEWSGFPPDGGYSDTWVVIRARGIPISIFPNSNFRRRAVKLHDLHHVLTNYGTDLRGEAEIGAWELASGCGWYGIAWYLNGIAALIGLLFYPRPTIRAWRRGRRSRNYYNEGFDDAQLDTTVGAARRELSIPPPNDAKLSASGPEQR